MTAESFSMREFFRREGKKNKSEAYPARVVCDFFKLAYAKKAEWQLPFFRHLPPDLTLCRVHQ
jgi:hypothetical protein